MFATHNHDTVHYTKTSSDATFWHSGNDGPESGCDADLLYHPVSNKHASDLLGAAVPSGLIIMWSGSQVPSGWALCDGSNGTPDLRGRFVIGAGGTLTPGQTGRPSPEGTQIYQIKPTASVTIAGHSLTVEQIAHSHSLQDAAATSVSGCSGTSTSRAYSLATITRNTAYSCGNAQGNADPHSHNATFTGNDCDVRPPYYTLAFIMKL